MTEPKPRFTLIPPVALTLVAATMTHGAEKYREADGADLWRKRPARDHLAAAMRHLYAHLMGQRLDPDTGLPHLAHCAARVLMACEVDATLPSLPPPDKPPNKRITRRRS